MTTLLTTLEYLAACVVLGCILGYLINRFTKE